MIESERLQLLEESKHSELAAMQQEMKLLEEREKAKKDEIKAIESRLIEKEEAKVAAQDQLAHQLHQVSKWESIVV